MHDISIHDIEAKDLPRISLLYEELTELPSNMDRIYGVFSEIQADKNAYLIGAYIQKDGLEQLAGTAYMIIGRDLYSECRPFGVVENVVVGSEYRRRGIGHMLMQKLEKIAKSRNCKYMILVSNGKRTEAHKMYESLGFDGSSKGFKKKFD